MSEAYITEEGAEELNYVKEYIITKARTSALNERRKDIDQVHIKEATKALFVKSSNIVWVLSISFILFSVAIYQTSILLSLSLQHQLNLWVLPAFSIIWVVIVTYNLRDFLRT